MTDCYSDLQEMHNRELMDRVERRNMDNLRKAFELSSVHADQSKPVLSKQTEGKAEGARYFYIDTLPALVPASTTSPEVCYKFVKLVQAVDAKDSILSIGLICAIIKHCRLTEELLADAIALRYQAIKIKKYETYSYMQPIDASLLLDAAARHLIKSYLIGPNDTESGHTHKAHFVANLLMISAQLKHL